MRLYVVRHGQTDLNKQHRIQARIGLPLNAEGLAQAEALRDELKDVRFDLAFSSPQERAVQTVRIASGLCDVETDERLQPFDVGALDGEIIDDHIKFIYGFVPDPALYKGVEDVGEFRERIGNFLDELIAKYGKTDMNIILGGHKCTTGCIEAYFRGMPKDGNFFAVSTKNGKYKVYNIGR